MLKIENLNLNDYKTKTQVVIVETNLYCVDMQTLSVVIFRLNQEWLALPTLYFKEVIQRRSVHRIPHRINKILLGVVNLNGNLQLCVNLHAFLEIESDRSSVLKHLSYQQERMIAIAKEQDLWVFSVDEIDGIYQWRLSDIEYLPIPSSLSTSAYKGSMNMDKKKVKLLDEELLFSSLKRSIN